MPDGTVTVWSEAGEKLQVLRGHGQAVTCLASLGGHRLASGSMDQSVVIWDKHGKQERRLETKGEHYKLMTVHEQLHADEFQSQVGQSQHTWGILALESLGDGRVVTGGEDQMVRVWDTETGDCDPVMVPPSDSSESSSTDPESDDDATASGPAGLPPTMGPRAAVRV